ncbi:sialidase family protein [soil metagenome]
MTRPLFLILVALLTFLGGQPVAAETVRIWDRASHCAFTDLVRWQDSFYCTFRESDSHVHGEDGKIRVIRSVDGQTWESTALIARPGIDLRDPKVSVTPEGDLMLLMGGSNYEAKELVDRHPFVAFLKPGADAFTDLQPIIVDDRIASDNDWLWRVTWHQGTGYGFIYQGDQTLWGLHLVKTTDGIRYTLVTSPGLPDKPNEATIRFTPQGEMRAVVRNEGGDQNGHFGRATAPFTEWDWTPINARLGGPDLLRLPDGSWLLGTRDYRPGGPRVVLGPLSAEGTFVPATKLPSGGDCSYPGMLVHDGDLWVSYYSGHEDGTTSIYLYRSPL